MIEAPNVRLTIGFKGISLDAETQERESLRLLSELREINEVNNANRIPVLEVAETSKSVGSFLVGLLTAEINHENAKPVLRFLRNRLSGKPIELEVEANGKKLKVSASSTEELTTAIQAAQDFISG